jgi:hypothetical protein
MSQSVSPHTAVRAESPHPSKNDPVILAAWRHGGSDTIDLARRFHTTEAHVYSVLAARTGPRRKDKPQYAKIGYAARPARKAKKP